MNVLAGQLSRILPAGMHLPDPIGRLYGWIEQHGLYLDAPDGERSGFLYPPAKLRSEWTDSERPGGTDIAFAAYGSHGLDHWLGRSEPELMARLCAFARTGAEGSMAAFWLDDQGRQRIVHLGSGSGSTLTCVLANDPVDFLRLIAIGYDEICWDEKFDMPPNASLGEDEIHVRPNLEFQDWVRTSFDAPIPAKASEIVRTPAELEDGGTSDDPFLAWVLENRG